MSLSTLTSSEAAARSALLEVQRYDIAVDMVGLLEGDVWSSVSTITFTCSEPGATTFVDVAMDIARATLNGEEVDVSGAADGRLPLPALAADNVLVVEASTTNTSTGEGILRTVDPTDKLVYVWTSLEPDEARRVWACFDQPDLKAPHRFEVTAPSSWLVTSNGAPESVVDADPGAALDARVWTFPDTPRLSTYVVVVNAGPFHEVRQQHDGHDLGFYCRQSLASILERDLDELVTLTRQGLAFFGEQFGFPFPQERYDQVFVPNLGGAMENWGCVTYGDGQLFRTPPTHAQRAVRAEFVFHEMAHMWFGDLVTMQWWDDLWLNEAFASWAANWGMASASEFSDQWATFLAASKRTAYEMDMSPARHPIRSEVLDVSSAMSNFDAITYVKGQSVLHQLVAYIGEAAFVAGLRDYFGRYAYTNTTLDDLMACYSRASGRDLSEWTRSWLDEAGTDVLSLDGDELVVETTDGQAPRPHRLDIAVFDASGDELVSVARSSHEVSGTRTPVDLPAGDLRLVNAGDLTFAAVKPDPTSLRLMLERVQQFPDPLDRALVGATAGQLLLLGDAAPRDVAAGLTRALATETSPALIEPFLAHALQVSDRWAPASESPALLRGLADVAVTLVDVPDARQAALRTLAASASTEAHWSVLEDAAARATDLDLAWRMAVRRSELGDYDEDGVRRLLESDPDPDAGMRRLAVLAAHPTREAKEEVWQAFFVDYAVPASRETLVLGSTFWRPGQAELLAPFTHRYLEELHTLKGGLLNQGLTIRAMYPLGAGDADFLAAAEQAADDTSLMAYARNQLRANSFVLGRILQARAL
ncbi:aminopeptidase N [Nocardioides hwasunensis]|uniref:Aminopeptidase N n=1 Tax=Nocardioides hwasunensis TaxID=397258 RepID=A0ABR8MRA0_9ACTN|nr:aminopeptidase N [Nocardioides hwasunensis]MBD3917084.1 aminopeptidase N [Nocardioides hwasunensis]